MIVASTEAYTESHLVHVIAFDAAGNETESEKVRFHIIHRPEEEDEEQDETGAILGPAEGLLTLASNQLVADVRRPYL
jgi:hypothetical protein